MRSAEAYAEQLAQLQPPGAAWPRQPDSWFGRLLRAIAEEFARVDGRALTLLEEADPLSALELLPEWERVAGLPDACIPISDAIRERQVAVARKIAGIGGQSIPFLIDLAERLGLEVEIDEFEPFTTASTVDGLIYTDDWRFAFLVRALPPSESSGDPMRLRFTYLTTESGVDERIRGVSADDLECVISRAAPAHANALFAYPTDPEPVLWFEFT